jgi:hypothetical protein
MKWPCGPHQGTKGRLKLKVFNLGKRVKAATVLL